MKIFRSIEEINIEKESIITVGSFDGIHLGHQHILRELNIQSQDCNCIEVLITFHPHPKIVLGKAGIKKFLLLTSLAEKLETLEKLGLSAVLIIPFTKEFSKTKYQEFVEKILVNRLNIKKMVVGYDHAFGQNREGHVEQLEEMSKIFNFSVFVLEPFLIEAEPVNSTRIRNALSEGNMGFAEKLLGRRYSLEGIVERGDDRGKNLGYPTANIKVTDPYKLIPKKGVYAVDIIFAKKKYSGMMNIGNRPTFNFDPLTLEVHIFNFSGSIYGQKLKIFFKKYLREEKKFPNEQELVDQILKDKEICENL
jgi:riboflavin kinase/FMN adenylyltransferase